MELFANVVPQTAENLNRFGNSLWELFAMYRTEKSSTIKEYASDTKASIMSGWVWSAQNTQKCATITNNEEKGDTNAKEQYKTISHNGSYNTTATSGFPDYHFVKRLSDRTIRSAGSDVGRHILNIGW